MIGGTRLGSWLEGEEGWWGLRWGGGAVFATGCRGFVLVWAGFCICKFINKAVAV